MQGNDLAPFSPKSKAVIFEGVLASPPEGLAKLKASLLFRNEKWDTYVRSWKPNTLAVKQLSDAVNRLGIGFEVYTFMPPQVAEAIDSWLTRKGVSVAVISYNDINELRDDLNINRGITTIYVAESDHYRIIGPRATVVGAETMWAY